MNNEMEIEDNPVTLMSLIQDNQKSNINYSKNNDEFMYMDNNKNDILKKIENNNKENSEIFYDLIPKFKIDVPEKTNIIIGSDDFLNIQKAVNEYGTSKDFNIDIFNLFPLFKAVLSEQKFKDIIIKNTNIKSIKEDKFKSSYIEKEVIQNPQNLYKKTEKFTNFSHKINTNVDLLNFLYSSNFSLLVNANFYIENNNDKKKNYKLTLKKNYILNPSLNIGKFKCFILYDAQFKEIHDCDFYIHLNNDSLKEDIKNMEESLGDISKRFFFNEYEISLDVVLKKCFVIN